MELRAGLPFIQLAIVDEQLFERYVQVIFGSDNKAVPKGLIEVIRPGDRVFFEPGEDHWHGAAPDRFMTHLSMVEVDDKGSSATWGAQVSDEEYAAELKMEEA